MLTRRSLGLAGMTSFGVAARPDFRPLTIGVEDRWHPFAFDKNGEASGLCVDMVRSALKLAGMPHRFEVFPYRRCLHLTVHGELDACMTVPDKPAIRADLAISRLPLIHATGLIFARKGSKNDRLLDTVADLSGHRLGVARGFDYGEPIDSDMHITRVPSSNPENIFNLLLLDRADFAIYEVTRARSLFRRRPELRQSLSIVGTLPPQPVYLAFSRRLSGVDSYRRTFDQALAKTPGVGHASSLVG